MSWGGVTCRSTMFSGNFFTLTSNMKGTTYFHVFSCILAHLYVVSQNSKLFLKETLNDDLLNQLEKHYVLSRNLFQTKFHIYKPAFKNYVVFLFFWCVLDHGSLAFKHPNYFSVMRTFVINWRIVTYSLSIDSNILLS